MWSKFEDSWSLQLPPWQPREQPKADIATMREALASMDASKDDVDAFIAADHTFHLALANGTQNPIIRKLIDSVVDLLHEQRKGIFSVEGGPQRGQNHHRLILAAVVDHDPEAAREAMQAHLQQVSDDSSAALEQEEELVGG